MPDIVEKERFETVTSGLKAVIDSKVTFQFIEPVDFAGGMTWDGTYRDLDVSANVPAGARAAMFNVSFTRDNDFLDPYYMRAKGGTNPCMTIRSSTVADPQDYGAGGWGIVPLNSSRVCQYNGPAGTSSKVVYLTGYLL